MTDLFAILLRLPYIIVLRIAYHLSPSPRILIDSHIKFYIKIFIVVLATFLMKAVTGNGGKCQTQVIFIIKKS